jgi:hypothetical protein
VEKRKELLGNYFSKPEDANTGRTNGGAALTGSYQKRSG